MATLCMAARNCFPEQYLFLFSFEWGTTLWVQSFSMNIEPPISLLDEDEEDIESNVSSDLLEELKSSVVYNLDWTVATVLAQLEEGAIDLQPQYQRRDAWTVARKSKLIESLILGLPVPHIVLAERQDAKGTFIVLDGKQRLTALAQFKGVLPASVANNFALTELPILTNLNGARFSDIKESDALKPMRNAFLNQPLRTAILRGWRSEDLLHLVFHRLNSQVVPLSPQELRQALIKGPFMVFLNDFSANSQTLKWLLNLDAPDFRMRDSELLLRLLGFAKHLSDYRGDLRKFLDSLARKLSAKWAQNEVQTKDDLAGIEEAIELWGSALGREFVGRKFYRGNYERRLNRAVLDAQVIAALDPLIAARFKDNMPALKARFEDLMTTDVEFQRAVEATTKSIDAVSYRIDRLRAVLMQD